MQVPAHVAMDRVPPVRRRDGAESLFQGRAHTLAGAGADRWHDVDDTPWLRLPNLMVACHGWMPAAALDACLPIARQLVGITVPIDPPAVQWVSRSCAELRRSHGTLATPFVIQPPSFISHSDEKHDARPRDLLAARSSLEPPPGRHRPREGAAKTGATVPLSCRWLTAVQRRRVLRPRELADLPAARSLALREVGASTTRICASDLKPAPPARPTSAISFRNPPPKSLRRGRRGGLEPADTAGCWRSLIVVDDTQLEAGARHGLPLQEGGLAVEMCALRLCGADRPAVWVPTRRRARGGGEVVDVTTRDRRVQPDEARAHPRPRRGGARRHRLDEDAAPLADGAIAQALVGGGALRLGEQGHGDAAGGRCRRRAVSNRMPCTIALSAPLSAGVSALISNRTAGFELSFSVRAAASGTTFESSRGGSATVWMSMENSTDAMSSLRAQWGERIGHKSRRRPRTWPHRARRRRQRAAATPPAGGRRRRRAALLNGTQKRKLGDRRATQMSALLVDLCARAPSARWETCWAMPPTHPARGGRVIDGIIGGIGDIGDAIGGLIARHRRRRLDRVAAPAALSCAAQRAPPPPPRAPTCARCNSECGVTPTSIAGLPGSNAAETRSTRAAARAPLPVRVLRRRRRQRGRRLRTFRYSGTPVTYCCAVEWARLRRLRIDRRRRAAARRRAARARRWTRRRARGGSRAAARRR